MPVADEALITREMGVEALAVYGSFFSWIRRPRLFWVNWLLEDYDGLVIVRK